MQNAVQVQCLLDAGYHYYTTDSKSPLGLGTEGYFLPDHGRGDRARSPHRMDSSRLLSTQLNKAPSALPHRCPGHDRDSGIPEGVGGYHRDRSGSAGGH